MSHSLRLMIRYVRGAKNLTSGCISFRLEKERYTPYTEFTSQWYCDSATALTEIVAVVFYIDNTMVHYGYPTDIRTIKKDGRIIVDIKSTGYTAALMTNQCPDGMLTDIDLAGLGAASGNPPLIAYQQNTPVVNYVNYYDGTSAWDAIVCYSIRATGLYPYLGGYNTIRVSVPENAGSLEISSGALISQSFGSDYSRIISKITMKDIDGTEGAYVYTNGLAAQRTIVRAKELNFDREWIMDPSEGLKFKSNYAMRKITFDSFSFLGCNPLLELLDSFSVSDLRYRGEIDRLIFTGSPEKGFVTTVYCYHDGFCE